MTEIENGFETGPRLQPVIDHLLLWQEEVAARVCSDFRQEAERIGLANRIDTAIQLLRSCDEFDVAAGAHWDAVPDLISAHYQAEIRIVDDRECDRPSAWRELEFRPGVIIRLRGGAVVIGGHRTSP